MVRIIPGFAYFYFLSLITALGTGFRAPLIIDCGLWLCSLFRIKACFRKHADCLVRKHNAEPGQGAKPRRARPEACICGVTSLDNGITIALRLVPCNCMLQIAQRPQAITRGALQAMRQAYNSRRECKSKRSFHFEYSHVFRKYSCHRPSDHWQTRCRSGNACRHPFPAPCAE